MSVQYSQLVNANGTIYNLQTGKGYSTPTQLAQDLGITADKIQWGNIKTGPIPSNAQSQPGPQPVQQQSIHSDNPPTLVQDPSTGTLRWRDNDTGQFYDSIPPGWTRDSDGNLLRTQQSQQSTDSSTGGVDTSGLPANLQGLLGKLGDYLTSVTKAGGQINPNITIGPNEIAQFAAAAHAQLDPYYQNQLAGATTSFLQQTGNDINQFNQLISNTQTQYGRSLEQLGAQSAEQGFAQSGIRGKQEGQLAQDTQTNIDQARRQLMFQEQGAAQAFAGQYGGANVPFGGFAPTNTRVLPGQSQFQNTGSNLPLYNLSDSVYSRIIGTQQNEQQTAEQNLTGQLASNAQQYGVNQSLRMLSL